MIKQLNNNTKYNYKTHTLEDIKVVPFKDHGFSKLTQDKTETCIVYCFWGNPQYIKFIYLSLLSFLKYTDISDFTIKIVTERNHSRFIRELFSPLLGDDNIIEVDRGHYYKWNVPNLSELKDFEKFVLVDADSFFYFNNDKPYPLFKQITDIVTPTHSFYSSHLSDSRRAFNELQSALMDLDDPHKFYKDNFGIDIEDFLTENPLWQNTAIYGFHRDSLDSEYFEKMSKIGVERAFKCDETVFNLNNYINGVTHGQLKDIVNMINRPEDMVYFINLSDRKSNPYWLHPIVGVHIERGSEMANHIKKLYNLILGKPIDDCNCGSNGNLQDGYITKKVTIRRKLK